MMKKPQYDSPLNYEEVLSPTVIDHKSHYHPVGLNILFNEVGEYPWSFYSLFGRWYNKIYHEFPCFHCGRGGGEYLLCEFMGDTICFCNEYCARDYMNKNSLLMCKSCRRICHHHFMTHITLKESLCPLCCHPAVDERLGEIPTTFRSINLNCRNCSRWQTIIVRSEDILTFLRQEGIYEGINDSCKHCRIEESRRRRRRQEVD